jgi:hypothetical protein
MSVLKHHLIDQTADDISLSSVSIIFAVYADFNFTASSLILEALQRRYHVCLGISPEMDHPMDDRVRDILMWLVRGPVVECTICDEHGSLWTTLPPHLRALLRFRAFFLFFLVLYTRHLSQLETARAMERGTDKKILGKARHVSQAECCPPRPSFFSPMFDLYTKTQHI